MTIKENVLYSLRQSRKQLLGLIESMKTREDWMHQVHPKANHPLWVVGHLALADNMFLKRLDPTAGDEMGWNDRFWFGSEISGDSSQYPETEEVLDYFHQRRSKLLETIEALPEEFFEQPPPGEGMFADAPNMGQMLIFIAYHEGMHSGQFTVAHRNLGHEPMLKPNPQG
jgi:uncharacterized damage-inducible protein DinB